jgi:hypothetical protein
MKDYNILIFLPEEKQKEQTTESKKTLLHVPRGVHFYPLPPLPWKRIKFSIEKNH